MPFCRHAIYYTPPPGPLARFGAAWLGWDMAKARPVAHPDIPGLPAPLPQITATPRRYGFHATIKPPFRMADGQTTAELDAALAAFCASRAPVPLGVLTLTRLGRFLALLASRNTGALNLLASDTVRRFDSFRAPMTPAEFSRRDLPHLSDDQRANLRIWGYPHVMADFRWHMTLTGKLPAAQARATMAALEPVLHPLLESEISIDALSLVGETTEGHFHLISRHLLRG